MITFNRSDIYAASNVASSHPVETNSDLLAPRNSEFQSGIANADTVSISAAARDMANGKATEKVQHTYDNLASARQITPTRIKSPATTETTAPTVDLRGKSDITTDNFVENAMQNILDNRMGIDKEKLKEIEAMMEEVAKDDSLSPEQKTKKLGELQELMDKALKESVEESVEKLKNQQHNL